VRREEFSPLSRGEVFLYVFFERRGKLLLGEREEGNLCRDIV
jgi:hypothetical protein